MSAPFPGSGWNRVLKGQAGNRRASRVWKGEVGTEQSPTPALPKRAEQTGEMMKRNLTIVITLLAVLSASLALAGCGNGKPTTVVLATTTSTQDSGLLDVLIPAFEKQHNVKVKTLAVGTGEALKMGERGDADVVLVHSRDAEEKFVADGFGLQRVQVMYNDFIIVGPQPDPAAIKGDKSASDAFKEIAAAGSAGTAVFVSRADDSGTNKKELALWKEAGIDPKGQPWYVETGQGMGETLTITNQKQGYTLSDRATYLARKANLSLVVLVEGDKGLMNQYGVVVVNPDKLPNVKLNTEGASDFAKFLTSKDGQDLINGYKINGTVVFHANAKGESDGMGNSK